MRVTVVGGRPVFIDKRPEEDEDEDEEDEDEPDEDEPDEDESPSTKTKTNGNGGNQSHTGTSPTHTNLPTTDTLTATGTDTGTASESTITDTNSSANSHSHSPPAESSSSTSGLNSTNDSSSSSFPSPASTAAVTDSSTINPVVGRAIGGTIGGLILLFLFVYGLLYVRRRALNKRRKPSGGTAEGFHAELWNRSKHLPPIPNEEGAWAAPVRRKTMREMAQQIHVPVIFGGRRGKARRLTIDGHREPRRGSDSHVTVPLLTEPAPEASAASPEPQRVREVWTETRNEKGTRFVALNVTEEDIEASTSHESRPEHVSSDSESLGRSLSHRQAEFVHQLYNNDVPAPAVAEVIERMLSRTGDPDSSSSQVAREPPPYETGKT